LKLCEESPMKLVGVLARQRAPPVVPASALGTWHWCRLKAWHNTSLFNTGWLKGLKLDERVLDGLALLWAAEIAKKANPRIIMGKIVHGEPPAEVLREAKEYKLAIQLSRDRGRLLSKLLGKELPYGLIEPEEYEKQAARYAATTDVVEYFRREEWPLILRNAGNYVLIGVPDSIEMSRGGIRVVELKTTSRPRRVMGKGISYRAALAQLAAYAWILSERWPLEEAVLIFRDDTGKLILRKVFDPGELVEYYEERLHNIARDLASTEPPTPQAKPPCRSCEYSTVERLASLH